VKSAHVENILFPKYVMVLISRKSCWLHPTAIVFLMEIVFPASSFSRMPYFDIP